MANFQLTKTQILERGITQKIENKETLISLAEIACHMSCSINKVRDCIKYRGLPAALVGQSYMTTKENVNRWLQEQHLKMVEQYMWDKRIRPSCKRKLPDEARIQFRTHYQPRNLNPQHPAKIDIASIVKRISKAA